MTIKEFWTRLKTAVKLGIHRFTVWFQLNVKPDLLDFIEENKELAMRVCRDVARDLSGQAGRLKRDEAFKRILSILTGAVPDIRTSSSWINLLIEIAVQALKAKGKL